MQRQHESLNLKYKIMTNLIKNEFQLEAEYKRWEILLSALKNENLFLILKLSEVLDKKEDKDFIPKAEYFQNEFINKDEFIKKMQFDIKGELLTLDKIKSDRLPTKVLKKHEKLKNEIIFLEKNFTILRSRFNKSVE